MRRNKLALLGSMLFILVLVLLPFVGACATTAPEEAEPVKIGSLVSLTGDIADWGPDSVAASEVKFDQIGWKVAGRPIKFVYEDDGSIDPVMSLDHAKKLVEVDNVDVIFQPICSGPFMSMKDYCNSLEVLTIGQAWRGEMRPWEAGENRYDICCGAGAQINYIAGKYAYDELGLRTLATLGHDYETGYNYVGSFADGFAKAGGKVVQQQWVPFGTVDFAPYLTALKEADFTAAWFTGPMMPLLVKQYHEFGFWDKQPLWCLINDSLYEPQLAELGDFTIGMYVTTGWTWTMDNPMNKKFVADFEAKTGHKPGPMAFGPYAATHIYVEAVKALNGNTDDKAVRDEIIGSTYDTPAGPVTFSDIGNCTVPCVITQVARVEGMLTFKVVKVFPAQPYPGYYTKP